MGNFDFAYSLIDGGNTPPATIMAPVATTQTLVVGDLVVLSSGQVAKASASITSVFGVMAEASTTQTAGTLVKVYPIMPGQVWRATADAAATSHVLAAFAYDINSNQTVDVGDNSGGCIVILKLGDATTDVYVMFTATDLA